MKKLKFWVLNLRNIKRNILEINLILHITVLKALLNNIYDKYCLVSKKFELPFLTQF